MRANRRLTSQFMEEWKVKSLYHSLAAPENRVSAVLLMVLCMLPTGLGDITLKSEGSPHPIGTNENNPVGDTYPEQMSTLIKRHGKLLADRLNVLSAEVDALRKIVYQDRNRFQSSVISTPGLHQNRIILKGQAIGSFGKKEEECRCHIDENFISNVVKGEVEKKVLDLNRTQYQDIRNEMKDIRRRIDQCENTGSQLAERISSKDKKIKSLEERLQKQESMREALILYASGNEFTDRLDDVSAEVSTAQKISCEDNNTNQMYHNYTHNLDQNNKIILKGRRIGSFGQKNANIARCIFVKMKEKIERKLLDQEQFVKNLTLKLEHATDSIKHLEDTLADFNRTHQFADMRNEMEKMRTRNENISSEFVQRGQMKHSEDAFVHLNLTQTADTQRISSETKEIRERLDRADNMSSKLTVRVSLADKGIEDNLKLMSAETAERKALEKEFADMRNEMEKMRTRNENISSEFVQRGQMKHLEDAFAHLNLTQTAETRRISSEMNKICERLDRADNMSSKLTDRVSLADKGIEENSKLMRAGAAERKALEKEFADFRNEMKDVRRRLDQDESTVSQLGERVSTENTKIKSLEERILKEESMTDALIRYAVGNESTELLPRGTGQIDWIVGHFKTGVQDVLTAGNQSRVEVKSPSFYTKGIGYKLELSFTFTKGWQWIYLFRLVGVYDELLERRRIKANITIAVVDQKTSLESSKCRHDSNTEQTCLNRAIRGDALGCGYRICEEQSTNSLITNDSLHIRVKVET